MLVSLEWLREITTIENTEDEILENIPVNGLEVETVMKTGIGQQNVVVGEILEKKEHPEHETLFVTVVDCGIFGKKQIVTDLTRVVVGNKVLVALEGVVLANNQVVKNASIKGVNSEGLFISWELLGFHLKSPDPIYLESSVENGTLYFHLLPFHDTVIDIELTANRGDCLGMRGIATDIKARFDAQLQPLSLDYSTIAERAENKIEVMIDTKNCYRYCGAIIQDIVIRPSPMWMQLRLVKSGIRPINNVVDITNYVLYEMNQPLHAFDYDQLAEGETNGKKRLKVRDAFPGEKMITLDGIERKLEPDDIVIADSLKGQCLGGVMGGAFSEVSSTTKTVFLESAFFRPVNIRKTSRRLGLRSESSYRFEREIDRKNVDTALKRALYYFDQLQVGKILTGIIDVYPVKYEEKKIITTTSWINRKLGTFLSSEEIQSLLQKILFQVTIGTDRDSLEICVPSARNDVTIREDVAEEVARIYGYNKIQPTYFPSQAAGVRSPEQKKGKKLHAALVGSGLSEVVNFSFVGNSLFDKMDLPKGHPYRNVVMLEVPLTEDWAGMRSSLIPGMLRTLSFNVTRKNKNLALFEIGNISVPTQEVLPKEYQYCCAAFSGNKTEKSYCQKEELYDFFDLKGVFDYIFDQFQVKVEYRKSNENFFHPYQQSEIVLGKEVIGVFGKLHPVIADKFDIDVDTFIGEFNVASLFAASHDLIVFKEVPKFPSSERDISVVLKEEITASKVYETIKTLNIDILQNLSFFDIYRGEHIQTGYYSVAIKLVYNKIVSTLKDSEIEEATNKIISVLENELEAKLR